MNQNYTKRNYINNHFKTNILNTNLYDYLIDALVTLAIIYYNKYKLTLRFLFYWQDQD